MNDRTLSALDEYLAWQVEPRHSKPFPETRPYYLLAAGLTLIIAVCVINFYVLALHGLQVQADELERLAGWKVYIP